MNEFQTPNPTELDMKSVFQIAERAADDFGYSEHNNIYQTITDLGGQVFAKDFWAEGSSEGGSLVVRAEDDFTIFVPNDTSLERDKFTIAHELGHYVLHYLWPRYVKGEPEFMLRASRYGSDRSEWEANWFAAAFLMPEKKFNKKVALVLQL